MSDEATPDSGARNPVRSAAARAAMGTDDKQREIALQLLPRISAVIRVSRSYSSDNMVFVQQLESVLALIESTLEETGEVVLVSLESDLFLNGFRIPVRNSNVKHHQHLLDELSKRRIAGLKLTQGVTTAELSTFFRLFKEPEAYNGTDLLRACVGNGIDHVIPVIHASTDNPEDGFGYDLYWEASKPPGDEALSERGGEDWGGGGPGAKYGLRSHGPEGLGSGDGSGGDSSAEFAAPRGAARKTYANAVQGARSLLTNTSLQNGMEMRHAKRVVQPLVDGGNIEMPAVLGLHTLSHRDEYTYAHAVNVTLVAVTIGHFLELDRRALLDLGVAALMHDVGKHLVADHVHHPFDHFDAADWEAVRRHPIEGAKLIARSTTLNGTTLRCMKVALEHHMTTGTDSYPVLENGWKPSMLSRIVQVADCYASLQGHRSERGANITPYMALGMMLGPLKPKFDPAMLWALVQTLGYFPPGQLIEMDDGSIAVVLSPNAKDLGRPHVRVLIHADGRRIEDVLVELRPIPDDRTVKRALPPESYPVDPGALGTM
ncbi:MAG: HD domain-containing protein [Candidatus Eisenbacteria bacterium]|uniref:HD domain-containing protein n=1 Tax=Eiseniibacteriota bacterium TaxID=2212470 RepID=A0A849SD98_UNCEI|nr:HD domain-containing protein [Candidatus Eisenbacteria bacterium]